MNLRDIEDAVEDVHKAHGFPMDALVHTVGRDGVPKPICGIDAMHGNLYVLGSDGKPAVNYEEYVRLKQLYEDMTSIALWSARRLRFPWHREFAYGEIERNLGREVERI